MKIDKDKIISMLTDQGEPGDADKADQARDELPDEIDPNDPQHQNLMQKFGVEPQQLLKKFTGKFGL